MCKVRFLIHVVSSRPDVNGNRSHFAIVTSTKTGKQVSLHDTNDGNAWSIVRAALGVSHVGYPTVYATSEAGVSQRQWRECAKIHNAAYRSHEAHVAAVAALEQE